MFRSPIFWKLTGAFVSTIVLSSITVWAVALPRVEEHAEKQVAHSLEVQARLVRGASLAALTTPSPSADQERFADLVEGTGTRLTLIDAGGTVLVDTHENPAAMEVHQNRPEILAARASGKPAHAIRRSRTLGVDMMYLALPLTQDGRLVGFARAAVRLDVVAERRAQLRTYVGTGALLAATLTLVLGLYFSRFFTRRMSMMRNAAEAIAAGDYSQRMPIRSRDEFGQLARAIESLSDQLNERMEALTRERNELQAILGSMLEGVVAVDREERILHVNTNAAEILETNATDCIGERIWEVARVQAVSETIAAVLADETEVTREARLADSMRERVLELIASPLRDQRGHLVGAVLVLHDVTELRRLELVRRDFVVNVSHELKTPLTAIRGFVETLIDDPEIDPETHANFLGRVKDQVLRLSHLVSDLLVLSRVESEEEALDRQPVDLRKTLRECAGRFSPESRGRTMEFNLVLPKDATHVLGDDESLRQVVDNLLDNAYKYTPDGGRVELRLVRNNEEVVIEVADTGIGIEGPHLDRIFERFYRVDKARSRELGGTGLGLSIVKHIATAHGGRVSVQSDAGHGSTFRVVLPRLQIA